ncbi:MAG: hypothetical protein K2H47_13015 [Muribaculaceae bacterium]|nr:hypothetical protein [Muribaculaceae bacterium]
MKIQNILQKLFLLLSICTAMVSCIDSTDSNLMRQAERLLTTYPDSALSLLQQIDTFKLYRPNQKARYALIKNMAYVINGSDSMLTSASLNPAISYYYKHGLPNERLRTLYCEGYMWRLQHNTPRTIYAFRKALDIKGVTDSVILSLVRLNLDTELNTLNNIQNHISNDSVAYITILQQYVAEADKNYELEKISILSNNKALKATHITLLVIIAFVVLSIMTWQHQRVTHTHRLLEAQERENLRLRVEKVEAERDALNEAIEQVSTLSEDIRIVVKERLSMLNALLAKDLSNNPNYAIIYEEWLEKAKNNKEEFMYSTQLAFKASHPEFIRNLEAHNLTEYEISYVCLYALGLRGKEVGEYLNLRRHYNISSDIRRKLGMNEHNTNLGIWIRRQLNQ